MGIDKKISKFWNSVSSVQKAAFFSALVWGLITHLAAFSAGLMYHDGLNYKGLGATYTSGRWMLGVLNDIGTKCLGVYQLPYINGFLVIFMLAISAALITHLLKVRSTTSGILIGAILVSFPSIASLFAFMFTAPAYTLSLLMSITAIYLVNEKPSVFRIAVGVCLICMSLGIYQAYLTFAASLALIIVLCDGLRQNGADVKALFRKGITFIITLFVGLVLYLLVNELILAAKGVKLTSYQSIDKMGQFTFEQLLVAVIFAYSDQIHCNWERMISPFMAKLTTIVMVLTVFLFICTLYQNKKNIKKCFFLFLLFYLFPLAINSVYLICAGDPDGIHSLMRYSLVFTYILPVVFLEIAIENVPAGKCIKALGIISLIVVLLVPLCSTYSDNIGYLNASTSQEQAVLYFNSLITRIRNTEGYNDDLPVAYIGKFTADYSLKQFLWENEVNTFVLDASVNIILRDNNWKEFCAAHLAWSPREVEDTTALALSDEVKIMPRYPDSGSIKIIDGTIVVKLSEVR